jgi:BirA family transcriptional regulator, biotin operon repressor / biotin---[acetyl-CoA-carboxylase] ligase
VSASAGPGLGLPRLHLRVTDSTNTRARELAAAGAPHGTLVTAAEQSAGRGRQGRTWSAPTGRALLCSLVLRDPPRLLPLAAGLAVAQVADLGGVRSQLKWPNDVLIGAGKAAGILVEGRPQEHWAVLGIGINVAVRMDDLPPELRGQAATLGLEPEDIEPTLATLLDAVSQWLGADEAEILSAIHDRDALRGQPVRWAGGEGVGAGIDADGRLVVAASDGRQVALDAGEIHLIR